MENYCLKCPAGLASTVHLSYATLDGPRAIRLLQLHQGKPADDIECTIIHSSLSGGKAKQMGYTPLSYVWGDQALPQPTILCSGALFHVTSNLEAALRALRREKEQKLLWIDQICINQADLDERSAQVLIMGDIYKEAEETIGWLGESCEDTATAIDFARELNESIEEISEELEDPNTAQQLLLKFQVPLPQAQGMLILFGLGADNPGWASLMHLFERPWFSRVWIIQEAMLSQNLTLHWGSEHISWEEMSELVERLENLEFVKTKLFKSSSSFSALSLTSKIAEFQQKETIALQDLLGISTAHQATDPRDRIYALLGLVKPSKYRYGLVPNYKVSVTSVFHSAARAIFSKEQNLRVLVAAPLSPPDQRLPDLASWCPDWSISERCLSSRLMVGWDQFKADGGAALNDGWDIDLATQSTLSLRGRIVDTLTKERVNFDPSLAHVVSEDTNETKSTLLRNYHRLATILNSCCQLIHQTTPGTEATPNNLCLWRSLAGGLDSSGKLVPEIYS